MTSSDIEKASATILLLLDNRAADATICPSEAARALTVEGKSMAWRTAMSAVHAAVDGLLHNGTVRLIWKGEPLKTRSDPYRNASGAKYRGRGNGYPSVTANIADLKRLFSQDPKLLFVQANILLGTEFRTDLKTGNCSYTPARQ